MIKTYVYRLYPRRSQRGLLGFLLEQARQLYNAALQQRIETYQNTGQGIRYPEQWKHIRDQRHGQPDTLGVLNATSIQQLLRRLDKAFAAFFRRLRTGENPGFPRFKGKNRFHSLEYRYGDGCKLREVQGRRVLYIQNVGEIRVNYHRPIPDEAQIKHLVLKQSLGKWYVCLMLELPDARLTSHTGPAVGVDMGLQRVLTFSDGTTVENPRWLRHELNPLRVAQRRLSRRKKGSHRRRKAARQVARIHERIAHQRRDFWHKCTREMAERYSLIVLEDLPLSFMTANPPLALSAHDAGLGEFQRLLGYKVEETGSRILLVNPQHTSQRCSGCGERVLKTLRVRVHHCPTCGLVLDRDINAARNILHLAVSPARTERSGANVEDSISSVA